MTSIMITGAGSTTAMSVVKGLRAQRELDLKVIGVDSNAEAVASYWVDDFHQVPRADSPTYLDRTIELCANHGVRLLIPIVDAEFLLLARHRALFAEIGCSVAVSEPAVVTACTRKIETFRFFQKNKLDTPATEYLSEAVANHWSSFPAIVKPNTGSGGRNTFRADSPDQLRAFGTIVPDPIVQEFVDGPEYTIDVLTDFSGQVVASVPRLRVETKAGVCSRARTVRDSRLIDLGRRVAQQVGLLGPGCIQGIDGPNGFRLIEINPRFAGSLVLTLAAGVNTPLMLVKSALGLPIGPFNPEFREVQMVRYWDEVYYDPDSTVCNGWQLPWH